VVGFSIQWQQTPGFLCVNHIGDVLTRVQAMLIKANLAPLGALRRHFMGAERLL